MKPTRTCIVCKQKKDKQSLNRIYKNADGEIVLDQGQTAQVRGAYICTSKECHLKLLKQKSLNRAFRQNISEENYLILTKNLKQE